MVHAENLERQIEQMSHALARRFGILVILRRDERQIVAIPAHDQIRAEEHRRRLLAPEGVM